METIEQAKTEQKVEHRHHLLSRIEASELGKSLRNATPRKSQSEWRVSGNRRDPVDILVENSKGREEHLIPIRYGRMLQSPFAFYRGAAAIMAADLATTPSTGVSVQCCGDCHLLNFGAYATPERRSVFDINDFDETLPAPWEWDVKRLAASFVIAALHNGADKQAARDIAVACVESYRTHTIEYAEMSPLEVWYSSISVADIIQLTKSEESKKRMSRRVERAKARSLAGEDYPRLTQFENGKVSIVDNPPLIFHFKEADAPIYFELVEEAFQQYAQTLGEEKRILFDQYRFVDFAAKVVGVGSVGRLCAICLRMTANNQPLFLQVKEATTSVLESFTRKSVYSNSGQRVVQGQKLMQAASDIFLGWAVGARGRHFYVRQLRDMKIRPLVEIFDNRTMMDYASLCGWALARAHARSAKSAILAGYMGNGSKFAEAVARFAIAYSDQNAQDFDALRRAVKSGRVEAYIEQ